MWYWACFACHEGYADEEWSWREAFDSALRHAGKPGHPKEAA